MTETNKQQVNYKDIFPFELDDFQKQAINHLNNNKNVLVCAPTGSGKTAIAEYAMYSAVANNQKIIYTSPLKALSNQKYFDLCKLFGEDKVGILTGDSQINREANILVMTTEIYRNILYNIHEEAEFLNTLKYLVLDECHYMRDTDRGTVWEESIIYSPNNTQIIALSATIGNPKKLSQWISFVHGDTELVSSHYRPVPLKNLYLGRYGLKPITDSNGRIDKNIIKNYFQNKSQKKKSDKQALLPNIFEIIDLLKKEDLLPAIYFIFSRRSAEVLLKRIVQETKINLLNEEEEKQVKAELFEATRELPWLRKHKHYYALQRGIACHHAGLLPALKNLVERLFQRGLIKIVFATETLAAGINMPARSTVISQISKRCDEGFRLFTTSEFLQMAGRAGRRGLDTVGHSIVLETPHDSLLDLAEILKSPVEDLHSAFKPSYTMVLNLAFRLTWEQVQELLALSFARFENLGEIKSIQHNLESVSPKKRKALLRSLQSLEEVPYREFAAANNILQEFNYIDSEFNLTETGLWAKELRADNILLLSEIINKNIFDNLTAYEIAGFITAFSSYNIRIEDDGNWGISDVVVGKVKDVYDIVQSLSLIQAEESLEYNIPFTPKLITVGFDWAISKNWQEFTHKYYFIDEGDLVKILRQSADLLKQIMNCPALSKEVFENIKQAYDFLYRPPILDVS